MTSAWQANALDLENELNWFNNFLLQRATYGQTNQSVSIDFLIDNIPPMMPLNSHFGLLCNQLAEKTSLLYQGTDFVLHHLAERMTLVLALSPHIRPQALDIFFHQNQFNRDFTEFGGLKGSVHKGFLPTGETLMYILAGSNLELRFAFVQVFKQTHLFHEKSILSIEEITNNEPDLSGKIIISKEYLQLLTTGEPYQPQYSQTFPAQKITTSLEWNDLVLDYHTYTEVTEFRAWIKHYKTLMKDKKLGKEVTGFRGLFYGESGTGKTLTTKLLGKELNMDIYRIDLSKIVSKYIGETEKNLHTIFEMAKFRDWILFFDEGDALFGKRSETKSSNDRYANQETAYLLQKIEEHPGVLILATNIRANLDKAFLRRFQAEVYFGIPNEQSRLTLWKKAFEGWELEPKIDLQEIAKKYVVSGAAIKNIQLFCVVMAMERQDNIILYDDFIEGLRKQLWKEGKTI
ncbi:MAG: ATP-binding protein [Bacteroidetes bacterium]|nr:MAG: ATP-binding protein [Bacteroidota bacterium]TAG90712.1 MAG: ATP-binding protein [Bacteroidota bacterium]